LAPCYRCLGRWRAPGEPVQVGPDDESSSIVDIEVLARRESHANFSEPSGAPSRLTRIVDAPPRDEAEQIVNGVLVFLERNCGRVSRGR
jgi:hypothetical protein